MPAMKEAIEQIFPLTGDFSFEALQKLPVMRELYEIDMEMFEKENTRNVSGMHQIVLRLLFAV